MGNLFGVRRRAPVVTAEDMAILRIKQTRDSITIYQKRIENDLESNKELAYKLIEKGAKDRALIVLKRKKFMQETLNRTQVQLEKLEDLVRDIEYSRIEVKVVEGLKVGTDALKQLNSMMDIGEIERMIEDNDEAVQKQNEISALLQGTSFNEEELLDELKALQDKEMEEQLKNAPTVPYQKIKDVPVKDLPSMPSEILLNVPTEEPNLVSFEDLPNVPEQKPVTDSIGETKQSSRRAEAIAE